MSELTAQDVLRKAHERMSVDNWASDGWGMGDTACLMHQLALAADERRWNWDSFIGSTPIGKATSYLRKAIKTVAPDWYELHGKYRDRREVIASFNDNGLTAYEDASMVLKQAWLFAEEDGIE